MRILATLAALSALASCTSLPDLPSKTSPLPVSGPRHPEITEAAFEWRDERRSRVVPVRTYAPRGSTLPMPVVVVSHGIGEDRDSYAWLGRTLAQHGFFSVHVTHAGTDRAMLERGYLHLYRSVKDPANWIARAEDVGFVLDEIERLRLADTSRSAVVGHSAGAFTAYALAGMRGGKGETFRDPRVRVAVPMSMPRLDRVVGDDAYASVAIPLLNITGTRDSSLLYRTFPRHRRRPFEATIARDQVLLTFDGVNHNHFSAVSDRRHEAIAAVTVAFLRAWLLDDKAARDWFAQPGRTSIAGVGAAVETK